jgi:TP901 family phage tail tape measure protein
VAFADTQKLTVELDLKGNLNSGLSKAARALQGFDRATSNTQRSLSKFGRNIERGIVIGIAATGTALLGVVKAASDYESAFAGVRKTVTATEPELKALSDQFRALSKEIPISAAELARLGEAGGALGVPTKQLKEFVRVTALLGVTTNLSADEAADALGVLGNVLHLTGEEYSKFASSLVALGNAGASTEKDIVQIAQRAGAAGELIGVSTDQILGFSSAVASLGIEAEAGGTAIQKFFIDSAKAVAGGGKDLKEFAKVAGVSSKTFAASFRKDAGGALQDFLAGLGKLPQAAQLQVLDDLGFTDQRITRTLLGLANNTKLVSDQMGVANKAFAENTALTKEAQERFKTFDAQVTILKNTLQDAAITIGTNLLPKITPLIQRLTAFINLPKTQGQIAEFGTKLASGFEKFATALGKVDWQPFIDGLKLSSEIATKAFQMFRSLPAEFQAGLIGAFAINKVTGGLGTAIVKDVGGVVLDRFVGRGSSPTNPLWVASVGDLPGGPGKVADLAAKIATLIVLPVAATVAARDVLNSAIPDMQLAQTNLERATALAEARRNAPATGSVGLVPVLASLVKPLTSALANAGFGPVTAGGFDSRFGQSNITAGGFDKRIVDPIVAATRAMSKSFYDAVAGLKTARKPDDVRKAVAAALAVVVGQRRGNALATGRVLADLKGQLVHTTDPETRKILQQAIRQVEHKLAGRKLVQQQLDKAEKIVKSSESTRNKIRDLTIIQKSLAHTSKSGQEKLQTKIDELKRSQKASDRATTEAIKDKDLSVSLKSTTVVNAGFDIRTVVGGATTIRRYGNATTNISTKSSNILIPS